MLLLLACPPDTSLGEELFQLGLMLGVLSLPLAALLVLALLLVFSLTGLAAAPWAKERWERGLLPLLLGVPLFVASYVPWPLASTFLLGVVGVPRYSLSRLEAPLGWLGPVSLVPLALGALVLCRAVLEARRAATSPPQAARVPTRRARR